MGIPRPASATSTARARGAQTRNLTIALLALAPIVAATTPPGTTRSRLRRRAGLPERPEPCDTRRCSDDGAPADLQPLPHPRGAGARLGRPRRARGRDGVQLALSEPDPLSGLLGKPVRRQGSFPLEP